MLYQSGRVVLILCEGLTHMLPTHNAKLSGSVQVANDGKGGGATCSKHSLSLAWVSQRCCIHHPSLALSFPFLPITTFSSSLSTHSSTCHSKRSEILGFAEDFLPRLCMWKLSISDMGSWWKWQRQIGPLRSSLLKGFLWTKHKEVHLVRGGCWVTHDKGWGCGFLSSLCSYWLVLQDAKIRYATVHQYILGVAVGCAAKTILSWWSARRPRLCGSTVDRLALKPWGWWLNTHCPVWIGPSFSVPGAASCFRYDRVKKKLSVPNIFRWTVNVWPYQVVSSNRKLPFNQEKPSTHRRAFSPIQHTSLYSRAAALYLTHSVPPPKAHTWASSTL